MPSRDFAIATLLPLLQLYVTARYHSPLISATLLYDNVPTYDRTATALSSPALGDPRASKALRSLISLLFPCLTTLQSKAAHFHPIYIMLHPLCLPLTTSISYSDYYCTALNRRYFARCTRNCSHTHRIRSTWNLTDPYRARPSLGALRCPDYMRGLQSIMVADAHAITASFSSNTTVKFI